MIACLPMYARPENRAAHDVLWQLVRDGLRTRGVAAPDALTRDIGHMDSWERPDLVLGQICNLPWRARFRDRVTLIGAGDYGLPDCPPGYYYSVFILRADDPATAPEDCARGGYRLALNEPLSNSGWGMIHDWARARGLPLNPSLVTGAHVESLRAVVEGRADWAALDAVTFALLGRGEPMAQKVRVVGRSEAQPGLTFCTAAGADPSPHLAALIEAIAALPHDAAERLMLRGVVALPPEAYDLPLPTPPALPAMRM